MLYFKNLNNMDVLLDILPRSCDNALSINNTTKYIKKLKDNFSKKFVIIRIFNPKILCTFSSELLYVLCSNLNGFVHFCSLSDFCNRVIVSGF